MIEGRYFGCKGLLGFAYVEAQRFILMLYCEKVPQVLETRMVTPVRAIDFVVTPGVYANLKIAENRVVRIGEKSITVQIVLIDKDTEAPVFEGDFVFVPSEFVEGETRKLIPKKLGLWELSAIDYRPYQIVPLRFSRTETANKREVAFEPDRRNEFDFIRMHPMIAQMMLGADPNCFGETEPSEVMFRGEFVRPLFELESDGLRSLHTRAILVREQKFPSKASGPGVKLMRRHAVELIEFGDTIARAEIAFCYS